MLLFLEQNGSVFQMWQFHCELKARQSIEITGISGGGGGTTTASIAGLGRLDILRRKSIYTFFVDLLYALSKYRNIHITQASYFGSKCETWCIRCRYTFVLGIFLLYIGGDGDLTPACLYYV